MNKYAAIPTITALAQHKIGIWRKPATATPTAVPSKEIIIPFNFAIEPHCRLAVHDNLYSAGSFTYCMSSMPVSVSIGRYCSIATGVRVLGPRHPHERISSSPFTYDRKFFEIHSELDGEETFSPTPYKGTGKYGITIGNDVWIGEGVTIAGSVKIGDGAVVAGNSHIVKDVEPYTIVGGNPAKFIKMRFESESLLDELKEIQWWKYKFLDFGGFDLENPEIFVSQLKQKVSEGSIIEYSPKKIRLQDFA